MDIRTAIENIGSLVARPESAHIPVGKLVGVSECLQFVTVDKGEFAGFPGSRYIVTPPQYLTPLVPTDLCRECPGTFCRYGCEASDRYFDSKEV